MVATLSELDENALVRILTEPKNAIAKQFNRLFEMEGSELEFREDALQAIARRAMERKTGARGLRTIIEHILLDTMYDLPSMQNVHKVVVDDSVVDGRAKPYFIYRTPSVARCGARLNLVRPSQRELRAGPDTFVPPSARSGCH